MRETKLTKAQKHALAAADRGGIFTIPADPSYRTVLVLQRKGLLTSERDAHGYWNITPAGRALIEAPQS